MKVIDLIKKLANDEKMPNKIQWNYEQWEYIEEMKDYYSFDRKVHLFNTVFPNDGLAEFLNDEVEIIGEEKEIKKLEMESGDINDKTFLAFYITHNRNKINELIDVINDMRDKEC